MTTFYTQEGADAHFVAKSELDAQAAEALADVNGESYAGVIDILEGEGRELYNRSGPTGDRGPAGDFAPGTFFFDTTLGHPIWSNGTSWVDATGQLV